MRPRFSIKRISATVIPTLAVVGANIGAVLGPAATAIGGIIGSSAWVHGLVVFLRQPERSRAGTKGPTRCRELLSPLRLVIYDDDDCCEDVTARSA